MHPVFKGMKPRVDNIGDVAGAAQCRRELGCKPRYRVECVVSNEWEEAGLSRPTGTKPLVQRSWAVVERGCGDNDTLLGLDPMDSGWGEVEVRGQRSFRLTDGDLWPESTCVAYPGCGHDQAIKPCSDLQTRSVRLCPCPIPNSMCLVLDYN